MITEGEAVIPLETTLHAFRNQEKTKQRSTIGCEVQQLKCSAAKQHEVNRRMKYWAIMSLALVVILEIL